MSVAGLGADGPELRVALESRPMRSFPGVVLLTGELFGGDTSTGLLVRSVAVGAEAWVEAGPRLRLGAGVDLGLVAYRRETRSEWPMLLAPGARAGLEVAAVQWRRGAIVLGGGVAGHIGGVPWLSASVAVGFRAAGGRAGRP